MTADRLSARTAEILAQARGNPRIEALSVEQREAWARAQAERELTRVRWLPGGLSWSQIESAYRELAKAEPARPMHRRRRPHEPSRPEVAKRLSVSVATLDRACLTAGRGRHWPPRGL
jgi:hypothetical protein